LRRCSTASGTAGSSVTLPGPVTVTPGTPSDRAIAVRSTSSSIANTWTSFDSSTATPPAPPNRVCTVMAPANTTVIPATTLAGVPLSSCSRRTPNCQDGGPPRSRRTTHSTSHGINTDTPTSSTNEPTPANSALRVPPGSTPSHTSGRKSSTPTPTSVTRHQPRRRVGSLSRTIPYGSTTTFRSPNSALPTVMTGVARTTTTTSGHGGTRSCGYIPSPPRSAPATNGRPTKKNPTANTNPTNAPISDSAAAMRRICPMSAPTRRSADSRRSVSAPARRLPVAMNTNSGLTRIEPATRNTTVKNGPISNGPTGAPNPPTSSAPWSSSSPSAPR